MPGRTTRTTTQTFWDEVAYDLNGTRWDTQNSNDNVFSTVSNEVQRASVLLAYQAVPGTTTGEVQANWDYVSGFTPSEPTYPNGGSLLVAGAAVAGLSAGSIWYRLTVPVYSGYTYEIYGNPTLSDLDWKVLPFAMSPTTAVDRHKYIATSEGTVTFYVEAKAERGFYKVAFRAPGANTGTP